MLLKFLLIISISSKVDRKHSNRAAKDLHYAVTEIAVPQHLVQAYSLKQCWLPYDK